MEQAKLKKILLIVTSLFNVAMLLSAAFLLIHIVVTGNDPAKRLTSHLATIGLTLLPMISVFILKEKLNIFVYIFYTLYIFLAVFLGATLNFYNLYESIHYDKLIHVFFGYTSALVAIYLFIRLKKLETASLKFTLLFIFSFAMMIAACWEILEFSSDQLFGTVTQGRPVLSVDDTLVVDVGETMFDMIANLIGAIIFMIQYTFHMKTKKTPIMNFMIRELSK